MGLVPGPAALHVPYRSGDNGRCFLQFFPELVKSGHVYILETPLFRVRNKKETHYCYDDEEKAAAIVKCGANPEITRFKGLGEMNPLQLRESTVDPDTRRLVQLTIDSETKTTKMMDMLLGKKRASDRKAWLEDKGDLAST